MLFENCEHVSGRVLLICTLAFFIGYGLILGVHAQEADPEVSEDSTALEDPEFEAKLEELITTVYLHIAYKTLHIATKLEELITTVYCPCGCTRETIKMCVCPTAVSIENSFRKVLAGGGTVEEIRAAYIKEHGTQFSAMMPVAGINWIAYLMPVVILLLLGAIALVVLQPMRSARQSAALADGQRTSPAQVSDETLRRVESELERYKREK